jgi:hypothetical protein
MRTYTTWLPLFLTILTVIFYVLLPERPALVGSNGLLGSLLTLVSTLPGFYIAGLAAVATFGSATMDHEMPAPAPEVKIRVRGRLISVKLTRRLFLSYLFSYLVVLSFGLCFTLIAINALVPSIDILHAFIVQWTGMADRKIGCRLHIDVRTFFYLYLYTTRRILSHGKNSSAVICPDAI